MAGGIAGCVNEADHEAGLNSHLAEASVGRRSGVGEGASRGFIRIDAHRAPLQAVPGIPGSVIMDLGDRCG